LGRYQKIRLFASQDQPLENFSSPVMVCYKVDSHQLDNIADGRLKIGTAADAQSAWQLLDTKRESGSQMACTSVNHFSLFDLFARIVSESVPATGFAPGVVTELSPQTDKNSYQNLGSLWLEIPSMVVKQPIVGVYPSETGWDLSWLGDQIGWLNSTAYPSWAGNSVLTGHVVNSDGQPGIFYNLQQLRYGDQIIVHLAGLRYVYEVRTFIQYANPQDESIFQHEDLPWLTLVTCKGFDEKSGSYLWRTVVRAVQTGIEDEEPVMMNGY
jgi:LPXTG-site transpeptidase (sortase) family protein